MSAPVKDIALAEARRLQAIMRAHGVECVIDLMPDSGGRWLEPMANRVAEMSHHIYSSRAHGLTRFYNFVRAGDPSRDLPGPLANGYGGWDEVYRIITLGRANHPGRGGPLTVAGKTIPKDNARPYTWGTEFEGGMNAADWTPSYRDFMARANAALLEWLGLPVEAHVEHSTWAPGRKSDRLGYNAALGRLEIAKANSANRQPPTSIAPPPTNELRPNPTPDLPAPPSLEETEMRIISAPLPWDTSKRVQVYVTATGGASTLDDATAGVLRKNWPSHDYDHYYEVETEVREAWRRADAAGNAAAAAASKLVLEGLAQRLKD